MNISLYTSTCKRKHEEAMKNMKNMKNLQTEVRGGGLRVFPVFHVFHVFHVIHRRVCVVVGGLRGSFKNAWDAGNSRPVESVVSDLMNSSIKLSISGVCQQ